MNTTTTFKTFRRKTIMKTGHALTRRIAKVFARQSLVGDKPILNARDFAFVPALEENWRKVRDEVQEIIKYRSAIPLFEEISTDQKNISASSPWRTYFLFGFGEKLPRACQRAPETAKLLSTILGLQNAFFSILEPGSYIPPHRGLTKGLLTCHLPLVVPQMRGQCRIRVDDQYHEWEEGRVFIFDDTCTHEVWNSTNQVRVVLLFHVDRPMRFAGRMLHRLFLSLGKMSAYVREPPRARAGAFEDRFEAAVRQSQEMIEGGTRG